MLDMNMAYVQIGDDILQYPEDFEMFFEMVGIDDYDECVIVEFETPELIMEYKPYDEYLKRHQYDPNTNTIVIDGKRITIASQDKKTRNRLNAFLRRHKYDPRTETILTNTPDPATGGRRRVRFTIKHGKPRRQLNASYNPNDQGITMDDKELGMKSKYSEPTYGHEDAHGFFDKISRHMSSDITDILKKIEILEGERDQLKAAGRYSEMSSINFRISKLWNKANAIVKARTGEDIDLRKRREWFGGYDSGPTDAFHPKEVGQNLYEPYKKAEERIEQIYDENPDELNSHDSDPEEFMADNLGSQTAAKYTRGRNTGIESLRNYDNVRRKGINDSIRKTGKMLYAATKKGAPVYADQSIMDQLRAYDLDVGMRCPGYKEYIRLADHVASMRVLAKSPSIPDKIQKEMDDLLRKYPDIEKYIERHNELRDRMLKIMAEHKDIADPTTGDKKQVGTVGDSTHPEMKKPAQRKLRAATIGPNSDKKAAAAASAIDSWYGDDRMTSRIKSHEADMASSNHRVQYLADQNASNVSNQQPQSQPKQPDLPPAPNQSESQNPTAAKK